MKDILIAIIIFTLTSYSVLFLNNLASSSFTLQKAIVLPLLIILILVYRLSKASWFEILNSTGKWNILFITTIFIQLIVISTGAFRSPLFIFIHLFTIGISLIFSFPIALLFMFASFMVVIVDISLSQNLATLIINDPYNNLLQIFSLIPIIPAAYIATQHYHFKDKLFKSLRSQVLANESIMESLDELIIITDDQLRILSINEAVERAMQKSDSELVGKRIFDVFLIKDSGGKLINNKTFFPDAKHIGQAKNINDELTLINSRLAQRGIRIHVQTIKDTENKIKQISFVISYSNYKDDSSRVSLDKAKAKYDANIEKIKQDLQTNTRTGVGMEIAMLEKIANDIYTLQTFNQAGQKNITRFDIAQLCKQTARREQDFFSKLKVYVKFEILDFGAEDIAPLTVKNFPVKPEELTGHFFTIESDIKRVEIIIKKLIDLGVFLASSEKNPSAYLSIQRQKAEGILLKMECASHQLTEPDLKDIAKPNYNKNFNNTNLHLGSGLEGYLVSTICKDLDIPMEIGYQNNKLTFSLLFKRAKTI